MSDWDDHFNAERKRIERILEEAQSLGMPLGRPLAPPPTRKETIEGLWRTQGRRLWPMHATAGGLILAHDLGIVDPIHYERKRYGDVMVVEAEGVIVERVVIHG